AVESARCSGDPDFGLHMAETAMADEQNNLPTPLYYALRNSRTLEEALRRLIRYSQLIHEGIELKLDTARNIARFTARARPDVPTDRHLTEFLLGGVNLWLRSHGGSFFALNEADFRHPRPACTAEHERIFRAPLHFESQVDQLNFAAAHLQRP